MVVLSFVSKLSFLKEYLTMRSKKTEDEMEIKVSKLFAFNIRGFLHFLSMHHFKSICTIQYRIKKIALCICLFNTPHIIAVENRKFLIEAEDGLFRTRIE